MAIINKGEVLISGKPLQVIESIKGKVWRKIIDKYELPNYAHLKVISNKLSVGKTELNVFSDTMPEAGFTRVEPNLEDVYFSSILS
jgi:ABC-2 type transport system ATP-binding protein